MCSADGGQLGRDPVKEEKIFYHRLMMFSGLTHEELVKEVARHDAAATHTREAMRLCVICVYRAPSPFF